MCGRLTVIPLPAHAVHLHNAQSLSFACFELHSGYTLPTPLHLLHLGFSNADVFGHALHGVIFLPFPLQSGHVGPLYPDFKLAEITKSSTGTLLSTNFISEFSKDCKAF